MRVISIKLKLDPYGDTIVRALVKIFPVIAVLMEGLDYNKIKGADIAHINNFFSFW